MKTVHLGGKKAAGRVALVDDEDYDLVMQYRWHLRENAYAAGCRTRGPYAATAVRRSDGQVRAFFMHKLLTGWPLTDHENHDGLDNQRHNLRPATNAQNQQNRRSGISSASRYKGVSWHAKARKWRAKINSGGVHRHLGLFVSEEKAALAYNAAAIETFGRYAYLNSVGESVP